MYDRLQGVLPEPIGEGSHFRIPWLQSPNVMDIRTRPRTISSVTGTKGMRTGFTFPHVLAAFFNGGLPFPFHLLHIAEAEALPLSAGVFVRMNKVCVRARTDLQMVNISLRVLSKPDTEELSNIYKARTLLSSGCSDW